MRKREVFALALILALVMMLIFGCDLGLPGGNIELSGSNKVWNMTITGSQNISRLSLSGVQNSLEVYSNTGKCVKKIEVSGYHNIIYVPNCAVNPTIIDSGVDNEIHYGDP